MRVTETAGEDTNNIYVTRFTNYISKTYATNVYESCSKYGLVLCGASYYLYGCSTDQMYAFLGKYPENQYFTLDQYIVHTGSVL